MFVQAIFFSKSGISVSPWRLRSSLTRIKFNRHVLPIEKDLRHIILHQTASYDTDTEDTTVNILKHDVLSK
jgi:hypothetical protein